MPRPKIRLESVRKNELNESQKIIANREQLLVLGKLLDEAYLVRRPNRSAYEQRIQLIRAFNEIAKQLYGDDPCCPVIEEFGSFSMDLFTTESDLDLSINFNSRSFRNEYPRNQKIKTLEKFARKFYAFQNGGHVGGIQPVMSARVPVLKVVDTGTGVECDFSVENRDGILKSMIIRCITTIDERFQKLSFLIKVWAKVHDINSSKDGTLNSLSIILLVAFHLQTRDPPILPPFFDILKGGIGKDVALVQQSVRNFRNFGKRNTETLGELFMSFFIKLASVERFWRKGLCASTYLGRWICRFRKSNTPFMIVEDFTDRNQNVARAVGKSGVLKIYNSFKLTVQNLGYFMNGQIEESALMEYLFSIYKLHHPPIELNPNLQPATIFNFTEQSGRNQPVDLMAVHNWLTGPPPVGSWGGGSQHQPQNLLVKQPFDHHPAKRMRIAEGVPGWGGAPTGGCGGTPEPAWVDPFQSSQVTQLAVALLGGMLQPPPYGNTFSYGPPFR